MTAAPFDTLPLAPATLATLQQLGWTSMTPVQAATLPLALAGQDLIAQAPTGSGKTAAFALALLARVDTQRSAVQALVLCPTRELAEQVAQDVRRLARAQANLKVLVLCGGAPLRPQAESLAHGAQVVVGTPGRLIDHLDRGHLQLEGLQTLVLDEADRMLDMGFMDDIARIAASAPRQRQTLLFSATYPAGIQQLAQRFLRQPQLLQLAAAPARTAAAGGSVQQHWYEVTEAQRLHTVGLLLNHFRPASTLAFCNTKQQCRDLVDVLQAQGLSALALHGDLEQRDRDQVLVRFAQGSCSVLVATDVAARGLDIAQLEAVINVDISPDLEVHTHRIGRTGRPGQGADAQGSGGRVFSLASLDEMGRVGRIEQQQGRPVEFRPLAELTAAAGAAPLVPAMVTIHILGGRKEKIRPGDVLGALTKDAGIPGAQVGKISVNDYSTYVAVAREVAQRAEAALNTRPVKGKRVKARILA
jgi:ATP-independent RNA helicase DbpA